MLQQLAQPVLKHTTGTANAAMLLHGPGGMFNTAGLENPFLSTVVRPIGLGSALPAFPTVYTDPRYGVLTEIVGRGETQPDEICDPAPTAKMKSGTLSAAFGRVQTATATIDLGTITQVLNNADRTDLMLMGQILEPAESGSSYPSNVNESNLLNNAIQAEMVSASFLMGLFMGEMLWQGDPASATTGGGYIPFNGLAKLVKTGYVDSNTGNVLPPVDSVIIDGAWGTIGLGGTFDLVGKLRSTLNYLNDLANKTVGGATFALAMRPEVWDAVSDVWAVLYADELTGAVDASSASRWTLNADSLTSTRDALKASMQLPIGGRVYPVVADAGIKQLANADDGTNIPAGSFSSSIYVLPLTVGPGMPVLYWEYLDWSVTLSLASQAGVREEVFWTDSGRFAWTMSRQKLCIDMQCRTEPRVILRTPQLAARIDDTLVTPDMLFRDPYVANDGYVAGGEETRVAPTKYGP